MSNNFETALAFTLQHEGGYVNDASDRGKETNYGVTQATYATYRRLLKLPLRSVSLIDRLEVNDIYKNLYWSPAGCNLLLPNLARCHFDWAVNHGVKGAVKTLQQVVETTPDGVIGPKTTAAIASAIAKHGDKSLAFTYCLLRENWYRHHVISNPSQQKFLEGWLNRVYAIKATIA